MAGVGLRLVTIWAQAQRCACEQHRTASWRLFSRNGAIQRVGSSEHDRPANHGLFKEREHFLATVHGFGSGGFEATIRCSICTAISPVKIGKLGKRGAGVSPRNGGALAPMPRLDTMTHENSSRYDELGLHAMSRCDYPFNWDTPKAITRNRIDS